nr:flagellar filament capping protein FliD [Synergistaceae bacterium]
RDGQLVINSTSSKIGLTTQTHTIKRAKGQDYDYLPFAYEKKPPFDGKLSVTSAGKVYTEGVDFEIVTKQDEGSKLIQSRIVWTGTNRPKDDEMFNVDHTYKQNAVGVSEIELQGGNLSRLGFHSDNSSTAMNSVGIATESANFGKSGLLEFNSDKLIAAMTANPQALSTLMTTFMRQVDGYIGNIVDSSSNLVGGVTAIKGRVASKVNFIDDQIATLTKQINNMDKTLKARQENLYKRYTDMETAMYKLNQQLASMNKFFTNKSSTSSA